MTEWGPVRPYTLPSVEPDQTYFLAIYIEFGADYSLVVGTHLAPRILGIQYQVNGDFSIQRRRWVVAAPGVLNATALEVYVRDTLARVGSSLTIITSQALWVRPCLCFGMHTPLQLFNPDELMQRLGPDADARFRLEAEQDGVAFSSSAPEMKAEEMYYRAVWALRADHSTA